MKNEEKELVTSNNESINTVLKNSKTIVKKMDSLKAICKVGSD